MGEIDVLILGAGPAGLSAAFSLLKKGMRVAILEKDNVTGGLMRSVKRDVFTLDFGYKRLYNRIPEVQTFWQSLLGDDFIQYKPRTGMLFGNRVFEKDKAFKGLRRGIPYNLLFSGFLDLIKCRLKYRHQQIKSLEDYAYSKRGKKFTMIFSQGFDERIKGRKWSQLPVPLLPSHPSQLNFMVEFLREARENKIMQTLWFHPTKGTGQIVDELENQIMQMGGQIFLENEVTGMQQEGGQINSVSVKSSFGERVFTPNTVISSLPLETMARLFSIDFRPSVNELSFKRGIVMVYLFLNKKAPFPHTSIQVSCSEMRMGRVTNYGAFGGKMVPPDKGCICVEFFCLGESHLLGVGDLSLFNLAVTECEKAKLLKRKDCFDYLVIKRRGADPATSWEDYITDPNRQNIYKKLEGYTNLYQVNRTGTDKATYAGLIAPKAIAAKNRKHFIEGTQPDISSPWERQMDGSGSKISAFA